MFTTNKAILSHNKRKSADGRVEGQSRYNAFNSKSHNETKSADGRLEGRSRCNAFDSEEEKIFSSNAQSEEDTHFYDADAAEEVNSEEEKISSSDAQSEEDSHFDDTDAAEEVNSEDQSDSEEFNSTSRQISCLELAARTGMLNLVKDIVDHSKPDKIDIDYAMYEAIKYNHFDVMQFLIETAKADFTFNHPRTGKTVFDIALEKFHPSAVEYLFSKMASACNEDIKFMALRIINTCINILIYEIKFEISTVSTNGMFSNIALIEEDQRKINALKNLYNDIINSRPLMRQNYAEVAETDSMIATIIEKYQSFKDEHHHYHKPKQ